MTQAADMIDVAFPLEGKSVPHDHRFELTDTLQRVLPWLGSEPRAGVHRLNLVPGGGEHELVSRRTRLVLRVPRSRADAACALAGTPIELGGHRLRAGRAQCRELLPHGTLYAWLVAADRADEAELLERVHGELDALGVRAMPVCGRWQSAEGGRLIGCSLLLWGLSPAHSLVLLQQGLGPHRRLGCGLFVPHRSAAAVGAPA